MSPDQAAFLAALQRCCEHCGLRQVRVLVGVSGGADSVALLRGLLLLRDTLECELHVAHLNHQLRSAESDADADWVQSFCAQFDVPCHLETVAIRELPELSRLGLEGTARGARQKFFQRTAQAQHCQAIAVAHTANDQAETILHHILRGTGLAGLRGINSAVIGRSADQAPSSELPVVRPLLQIERQTLEHFLQALDQPYCTDSTNSDTKLTRNRIRHDLLPLLAREFNPNIQQALIQLGQQAQETYSLEAEQAEILLDLALLETSSAICRLRCTPLLGQPPHCLREVFVRLWHRLNWPRRQMGFADWSRLTQMVDPTAAAITLPGKVTARRRAELLVLTRE